MRSIALSETLFKSRVGFEVNHQFIPGIQNISEDSGKVGSEKSAVHVREEPAPFRSGTLLLPELSVVVPTGVIAVGFRNHKIHVAVDVDF